MLPIKLHMHRLTWCKASFGREVHRLLKRHLRHHHVVQQLIHRPLLHGQCKLLAHLQLLEGSVSLVNQQLWLVLHEVDEQRT